MWKISLSNSHSPQAKLQLKLLHTPTAELCMGPSTGTLCSADCLDSQSLAKECCADCHRKDIES